jgi:hypothetical protein
MNKYPIQPIQQRTCNSSKYLAEVEAVIAVAVVVVAMTIIEIVKRAMMIMRAIKLLRMTLN